MESAVPTHCPICGAATPVRCWRTHIEGGITYTLYECGTCAVQFWSPLINPGAQWYAHDERYAGRNANPVWEATKNQKKTITHLSPFRGTVLDVGCGIGNFLAFAVRKGWRCSGIDFDADAVAAGAKRFGLDDLSVNDIVTYSRTHTGAQFDLVTFFDVLEHVDNHNEFIDAIRRVLKPGGYIAMTMPYRYHAEWLMPLDVPPRHLTRWNRTALTRFLSTHGFETVRIRRRTEGIWPIVMKLRFRFGTRLSCGAVNVVRSATDTRAGATARRQWSVRLVHLLAKLKDALVFGIPAILIWVAMIPSTRRYVTLYAIARKVS